MTNGDSHTTAKAAGRLGARLFRALGLRWVFSFGTMPIPYHPLVFPVAIIALLIWAGWSAFNAVAGLGGGDATWAHMLAVALALAIPMSIPIVSWVGIVFRVPLLQGLLFLTAMVLLVVDCASGRVAMAWAVLPAAYFGLFAVQFTLGRWWLRRLEAERERFTPLGPGQATVALDAFDWVARDMIRQSAVARLHAPALRGTVKPKAYHWLKPQDAAALRAASAGMDMPGWSFEASEGGEVLVREGADRPSDAIVVRAGSYTAPAWLVTGLKQIEARGGGVFRRFTFGEPMVVDRLPLFMLFRWTALVGRNEWVAGFPRRKATPLPELDREKARSVLALFAVRGPDRTPYDAAGLGELYAEIEGQKVVLAQQREAARARLPHFWESLAKDKGMRGLVDTLKVLEREPDLLASANVPIVLDWLERARDVPSLHQVHAAARLLDAFPGDLLAPHAERLGRVFNSRRLALQWNVSEVKDWDAVPKRTPVFAGSVAGFGLYLLVPGLYARLAAICPDLRNVERGLDRAISTEAGVRDNLAVVFTHGFATKRKQTPPPSP